ncbi:MAG: transglycosylase SLT domain-containing protein [Spirochaetaceae bacterium]|nr:transglycosylase SLT domain-containing protein [Spirochaetaceae bacterium]
MRRVILSLCMSLTVYLVCAMPFGHGEDVRYDQRDFMEFFDKLQTSAVARQDIGMNIPDNGLIHKYRTQYSSGWGYKWLAQTLENGALYRAYTRQKLAEYGLPACLEYLPVIESGFNPNARSRSGAVGLWQFMENSVANYLVKNETVDERYNPWKSTDAALRKLSANYQQFGDWALALAAYNLGAGAVQRALDKSGDKDYWSLVEAGLLREQTVQYVPKFLAVADLVMNSGYYGLVFPDVTDAGGVVPPEEQPVYVVQEGDTLWGISRRHNVLLTELCRVNNLDAAGLLTIGKVLNLPIK